MDMDKGKRMLQEREENPSEIPLTKSRNSQILHWQYILRNLSEKKAGQSGKKFRSRHAVPKV